MFDSIFSSAQTAPSVSIQSVLICMAVSIVLGVLIALLYRTQGNYSESFILTLAILPTVVQSVILVVNGNLGAAVAVTGAFGLVRFRSLAGSAREITFVFYAMAAGLICGMGYVTFAIAFVIVVGLLVILLSKTPLCELSSTARQLKISIPENLDYDGIFDDIFSKYLAYVKLERVRTTNLGSMFEITYNIKLKNPKDEKAMIDELRCRNGNLTILCQSVHSSTEL